MYGYVGHKGGYGMGPDAETQRWPDTGKTKAGPISRSVGERRDGPRLERSRGGPRAAPAVPCGPQRPGFGELSWRKRASVYILMCSEQLMSR